MSTKDKLIERFKKQPKDFTWEELVRLFGLFGFTVGNSGKTSGSRARFKNDSYVFYIHKPHPSCIIKKSALNKAVDYLKNNGFID
jgi:hypothetical protein